ncbi:MAG: hypothetical protein J7L22_01790, partial [Candidatus Marinimicrobia bacterium]|nr:hypothetical protein [Candidatus Neomarinimicrobiota bacterium]
MKYFKIVAFLPLVISELFAWEWHGIIEDMSFEQVTEVVGSPFEVENDISRIGDKKLEISNAKINFEGFILIASFSREHFGTELYGRTIYNYNIMNV